MKQIHSGDRATGRTCPARRDSPARGKLRPAVTAAAAFGSASATTAPCLAPRRGEELAITTDLSIEGQHFRLNWHQPEAVGHRVLARGLSDLAAMGARPVAAFLSLGLPRKLTVPTGRWPGWGANPIPGCSAFSMGCWPWQKFTRCHWLAAIWPNPPRPWPTSCWSAPFPAAALCCVPAQSRATCSMSRALWAEPLPVLHCLENLANAKPGRANPPRVPKKLAATLAPHLYPQPRITQGLWLQRHGLASAALDLSDGLSSDLAHICDRISRRGGSHCERAAHPPRRKPQPGAARRRGLRTALHSSRLSPLATLDRRRQNHKNRPHRKSSRRPAHFDADLPAGRTASQTPRMGTFHLGSGSGLYSNPRDLAAHHQESDGLYCSSCSIDRGRCGA